MISRALALHESAIELAVEASRRSAIRYGSAPNDIVRDATFVILHDAVIVHRAVATLAEAGWPGVAAGLLRTLLDLTTSFLAILNSRNPSVAAFTYFYASFRALGRDPAHPPHQRRAARDTMRKRIQSLSVEDRPLALAVLKAKDRAYWFSEEWRSPAQIVNDFGGPLMADLYSRLSSAAHGGFFGTRLFRDDPDAISINPQLPPGEKAAGIVLISSRLLVDLVGLRDCEEGLGLKAECAALRHELEANGQPGA
jgi:hypothetical protein